MIIDIRYHIASLVSVFLALGLGILIGSALLGNDPLVKEQEKMISRLEKEFDRMKSEARSQQDIIRAKDGLLEVDQRFYHVIVPYILRHRLADRRIAIVRANNNIDPQLAKDIATLLKSAGAEVSSVTTIQKWPNLSDPVERQTTAMAFGMDPTQSHWVDNLFNSIIEELSSGRGSKLLASLQSQEYFLLSGNYNRGPVDTVLFLGGDTAMPIPNKRIDLLMIDAARRANLTVVGVEPFSTPVSYMSSYRQKGITTVDNVELTPGQVALVLALADGKRDDYGVKEGARALMPEINPEK